MEVEKVANAFRRGYGTALDMFPVHQPRAHRFLFRGRDLSKISANEALQQDWSMVEFSMASALRQIGEQEDERALGHGAR